jgi:alkylated DNA repair dioxygenase AlkB
MNNEYVIKTKKSFLRKFNLVDLEKCNIDQALLDECVNDIKDKFDVKPPIVIWGKQVNQQRDVGFFSDKSIGYYYSNQLAKSKPMTINLDLLLELTNEMFGSNFNGILINRYSTGQEYIGPHSDDEKNLDKSGVIAISYGGERIFRIRDKVTKEIVQDIPIKNLDIIHMGGDFQKEFTHEVPLTKLAVEPRYSFTFRHHKI